MRINFWGALSIFCFAVLLICFFPRWFTQNYSELDFTTTGQIGDTIGGIMGPFIAMAVGILTFLAFWVQFQANEKLIDDTAVQRFENRFFEMVRIHRENVTMVNSRDLTPRHDLFITMFFELKFIFNYTRNLANSIGTVFSNEEIFNISYILFYSGANPDTTRTENPALKNIQQYNELFSLTSDYLRKIRDDYKNITGKNAPLPQTEEEKYNWTGSDFKECKDDQVYCFTKSNNHLSLRTYNADNPNAPIFFWLLKEPFTGHTNELGPYFQHLFQTIKYLDIQDSKLFLSSRIKAKTKVIIQETKYGYFKLLRAQFSTYELLLIYYHALSFLGDEWLDVRKGELLKRYKLLKKLPVHYADFYESPEIILKKIDSNESPMFDEYKLTKKMQKMYDKRSA